MSTVGLSCHPLLCLNDRIVSFTYICIYFHNSFEVVINTGNFLFVLTTRRILHSYVYNTQNVMRVPEGGLQNGIK